MKLGKVLMASAVSGMLAALTGCGGGAEAGAPAKSPSTDVPSVGEKNCCKGRNSCKGKSGCKSDANACAGQNDCKGKGTSCPKG